MKSGSTIPYFALFATVVFFNTFTAAALSEDSAAGSESFFTCLKPAEIANTAATDFVTDETLDAFRELRFWRINHGNHLLEQGKHYGVVYRSKPVKVERELAMFLKNSSHLKQFSIKAYPTGAPEQMKTLIVNPSPVIKDWSKIRWEVPDNWCGKTLEVAIESSAPYHPLTELSFSDPFDSEQIAAEQKSYAPAFQTTSLFSKLTVCFKLVLFPMVWLLPGAVLLAIFSIKTSYTPSTQLTFVAVFLTASLLSYVLFLITVGSPPVGRTLGIAIYVCSTLLLGHTQILNWCRTQLLHNSEFLSSLYLWALASFVVLFSGMLFAGWDQIATAASVRYLEFSLPADNILPGIFVNRLYQELPLNPFFNGWLSSDRPPLQSAMILLVRPFMEGGKSENDIQILSIALQTILAPISYVFLRNLKLSIARSSLLTLSIVFSSSFLLNGIFVWPKLLPTAYLLLTTMFLFSSAESDGAKRMRAAAIGVTSALSLLTHGGSLFGLLPLFLIAIAWMRLPRLSHWTWMLVPFFLLMLPWMYYQKAIDPPGDMLLRWHIAGAPESGNGSFLSLLLSQYQALTLSGWFNFRWENLKMIWGNWSQAFMLFFPYQVSSHYFLLRSGMFLSFAQSLLLQAPLLALGMFGLIKSTGRENARTCTPFFFIPLIGILIWVTLMYLPQSTILHQGTYYLPVCFTIFFLVLCMASFPRITAGLLILQILLTTTLWILPAPNWQIGDGWLINETDFDKTAMAGIMLVTTISILMILKNTFFDPSNVQTEATEKGK